MRLIMTILMALLCGTVSAEVLDERRALIISDTVTINSLDTGMTKSMDIGGFPFMTIGICGVQADDSVYVDSIIIYTADVDSFAAAVRTVNSTGSIAYSKFATAFTSTVWYRKSVALPPSRYMWIKFFNAHADNGPNTLFKTRVFVGP